MPLNKVCIGFVIITLFGHVWGCSGIRVSQDYDLSRDFSSLSTYAWQTESQPETGDIRVDNSLLDARFRSAINDSLTKRGYQKGEQENADFYVAYTYQIDSKIESSNVTVGFGLGGGSGGAFTGIGVDSGGRVREYDEGLLVIDLIDTSNADLLWRGTGTTPIIQHAKPEKTVKNINEWVEKILAQFPPQPK
jgi:hypothetical protein